MGSYYSSDLEMQDYDHTRQNYPYCWKRIGSKNFDYWNGKRYTKISRGFYPHLYSNGYLWGRVYNPEYYRKLGWEYDDEEGWMEIEKAF